jgi:rubrerythrin
MSILLSSAEIFDLAKAVEKGGQAYYQAIASSTSSPELKELFDFLAAQEQVHYRTFEKLARDYPQLEVDEQEWEQTRAYIQATSDSRFFLGEDKALSLARTVKDPLKAVDIAIGFEKDTLLFFYELLAVTPAKGKEAARAIVEEEKRHVLTLSERRKGFAARDPSRRLI